jgi:hypothetical protein
VSESGVRRRVVWTAALILAGVVAVMDSGPRDGVLAAEPTGVIAPADTVQALRATLALAATRTPTRVGGLHAASTVTKPRSRLM